MLDKEDLARLDERYVKQVDCTSIQTDTDKRIDAIHESQAVMNAKLNILIGILSAIGVSVLGIAVKLLFGG
jgi:hypothetical protein